MLPRRPWGRGRMNRSVNTKSSQTVSRSKQTRPFGGRTIPMPAAIGGTAALAGDEPALSGAPGPTESEASHDT